jgi:hypothetical protein
MCCLSAGVCTCWPHLKRKVAQGEYLSRSDDFFEELNEIMLSVHFSQTYEMMELLIKEGGNAMHPHSLGSGNKLRTLWNEYFVEPWACWSIGLYLDTPLNISNNQPIESWHKTVMRLLQHALKGSTASVLEHSFPKIISHASIRSIPEYPTRNTYHVCIMCVSYVYHMCITCVSLVSHRYPYAGQAEIHRQAACGVAFDCHIHQSGSVVVQA